MAVDVLINQFKEVSLDGKRSKIIDHQYMDCSDSINKLIQIYPKVGREYFNESLNRGSQYFIYQVQQNKNSDDRARLFLELISNGKMESGSND